MTGGGGDTEVKATGSQGAANLTARDSGREKRTAGARVLSAPNGIPS